MNIGGKSLKCARYDSIGKAIKDHINFYTLIGFACEFLLKLAANRVVFPDIGFQVNALLCCINCLEHMLVEVASIIIDLDTVLTDIYFLQRYMRKTSLIPVLSA